MGYSRLGIVTAAVSLVAAGALPALLPAQASAAPAAGPTAQAFPAPGDRFAAPSDDITLRGVDAAQVAGLTVSGATSGVHPGKVSTLENGQGITFDPASDFQPGETVTVRTPGVTVASGSGEQYTFTVAVPGPALDLNTLSDGGTGGAKAQAQPAVATPCPPTAHTYVSRPDLGLVPGACTTGSQAGISTDKILTSSGAGPAMFDTSGNLVWFGKSATPLADNFQLVNLNGTPLLAYYQGVPAAVPGSGLGKYLLLDKSYKVVHQVIAAQGYQADLHEMQLTPQGTALVGSYFSVNSPLGPIIDYVVQEVELDTGNKLFEWHAMDHVSTADSHFPRVPIAPWDWIHGNSIQQTNDGNILLSGRHTWALYKINRTGVNGKVGDLIWTLGGNHSNFAPLTTGPGVDPKEATPFCWQHHARQLPGGAYTLFDNASAIPLPRGAPCGKNVNSRGLQMTLTEPTTAVPQGTAVITRVYRHDPEIMARFAGDMQTLPNGSRFLGYGGVPQATLFDHNGNSLLQVNLSGFSYRAFLEPWVGQPTEPPAAAVRTESGATVVYASWNGATKVSQWRVLAGPDAAHLAPVGGVQAKTGFETRLAVPTNVGSAVRVQALDSNGTVLGTSGTPITGSTHLQTQNGTAQIGPGTLNLSNATASGGNLTLSGSDLTLPPANANFGLLFGLIPAQANISLTPTSGSGNTIPVTGTFSATGSTLTFQANLHINDFSVLGFSLQGAFLPTCATSSPVTITASSTGDPRTGAALTGTYSIPNFTNCGFPDDAMTALLSGPGNTINLTLGS